LPWDDLDFTQVLDALVAYGFVVKYTADGKDYGAVPSWSKHQVVNVRERHRRSRRFRKAQKTSSI
jgi:hypothetical protein